MSVICPAESAHFQVDAFNMYPISLIRQSILRVFLPLFITVPACGQSSSVNRMGHCLNKDFDREVASWLGFTMPAIDVDALKNDSKEVLILDAREPEEFAVSHIPGARHCGYTDFALNHWQDQDKSRPVVVYCSIGYRSEKIAQKLKRAGFTQVSNLYGSIFEWANRGYPLVDKNGQHTRRLHTYNRKWGRWVKHPDIQKTVTGD